MVLSLNPANRIQRLCGIMHADNRVMRQLGAWIAGASLLWQLPHARAHTPPTHPVITRQLENKFSKWGRNILRRTLKDFSGRAGGLLADRLRILPNGRPVPSRIAATAWDQGLMILMLAAGAANKPTDAAILRRYRRELNAYWRVAHGVGGFNAEPGSGPLDRYYDDNEWITWGFIRAYRATHARAYLRAAEADYRFVLSGRNHQLGGGIFWHEQNRNYKNTCANAPAVIDALQLYRLTHELRYLHIARSLYRWVNAHLQSPQSHLFYDGERLNHSINKMEWSYNTGAMLCANSLLYTVTHRRIYLHRADQIAHAAVVKWITPSGGIRDGGPFAWVLVDGFLYLYRSTGEKRWLEIAIQAMLYVHGHCRDSHGLYGRWWGRPIRAGSPMDLLDQAAAGGAFFRTAKAIQCFLRRQQP